MEDAKVETEYLSIGANRQTAVADWSTDGVVAFGADTNIALWRPDVRTIESLQYTFQSRPWVLTCVLELYSKGYHRTTQRTSKCRQGCEVYTQTAR